jgi:hypothetical protein
MITLDEIGLIKESIYKDPLMQEQMKCAASFCIEQIRHEKLSDG